ncbi:MAG: ATPase domain-containing protein, partial [Candidatus Margulisiibacteriota bacterium]
MIERLSTGVRCIDDRVLGFPKNKTTVILGETGIGKTMFGLQFARAGLYSDERVGYFVA